MKSKGNRSMIIFSSFNQRPIINNKIELKNEKRMNITYSKKNQIPCRPGTSFFQSSIEKHENEINNHFSNSSIKRRSFEFTNLMHYPFFENKSFYKIILPESINGSKITNGLPIRLNSRIHSTCEKILSKLDSLNLKSSSNIVSLCSNSEINELADYKSIKKTTKNYKKHFFTNKSI